MNVDDNVPLTKEFRMDMARFEIPVSGCTCLRTENALVLDQKRVQVIEIR